MMDIEEATETYERWAFAQIRLVAKDLERKHQKMALSPFPFLRATFYRWAQLWPERCKKLNRAPTVLAVGDLHVENFGTWRDLEGRLVWGINDFDEVYRAPYTVDLVRLATSALIAFDEGKAAFERGAVCKTILAGYVDQLAADHPKPFVLDGSNRWLRTLALGEMKDPAEYWQRFEKLEPPKPAPSIKLRRALEDRFPERGLDLSFAHRVAGLGSLGRQRILARATWHGSTIAREAKELLPSAWVWAKGGGSSRIRYNAALKGAIRCPDPFVTETDGWIIRRLAPDCTDIDIVDLPKRTLEEKLLRAMGVETANMHLGTAKARAEIRGDLEKRKPGWLERAADAMVAATHEDFSRWQQGRVELAQSQEDPRA